MGGMEYAGATMTEFRALGHEMFHCYFARGLMPAKGNTGWVDEALASWRDEGYRTSESMSGSSRMSSRPYYTRTTDRAAYSFGERFMRYLDGKLKHKGGLKPYLRELIDTKVHNTFLVQEFILGMEQFYGVSVEADFIKYTFGTKNSFSPLIFKSVDEHPIHRKMTLEEMRKFL